MNLKLILIIIFFSLLFLAPISAKVLTSKVDDKEIVDTSGTSQTLHTVDFGDVRVSGDVYEKVMIGDNITFSTNSFGGFYTVYRINGVLI